MPDVGYLAFVYDRTGSSSGSEKLTDARLRGCYYLPWETPKSFDWASLLEADGAARGAKSGAFPLVGLVHIERWESNIDFRIKVAAQAFDPLRTRFDGVLTSFDKWEWHPKEGAAIIASSMGVAGP
jgi:hypothetical protein